MSAYGGHRAVAALLFGSGLCALVYQVAWLRLLRLVFGRLSEALYERFAAQPLRAVGQQVPPAIPA